LPPSFRSPIATCVLKLRCAGRMARYAGKCGLNDLTRLARRISRQGVQAQDLISLNSFHAVAEKVDEELRTCLAVDWLLVAPHVRQALDWFARPKVVS
jgi:hypothetical protein